MYTVGAASSVSVARARCYAVMLNNFARCLYRRLRYVPFRVDAVKASSHLLSVSPVTTIVIKKTLEYIKLDFISLTQGNKCIVFYIFN